MRRLTLAAPLLLLAVQAFARAGGGEGYHSGGGSFSGGSYSGGSSFSGGSSSGGGDLAVLLYWFAIHHPWATLMLVVFGLYLYSRSNASAGEGTITELPGNGRDPERLDTELPSRKAAALAKLRAADPDYDEAGFLERAKGAFLVIQDAWSRQDMSRARAFVSDGVHERFTRQIAEYVERGVRNRMSDVVVREARALGYRSGSHYDAVYVAFTASATDELVRLADETALSGGQDVFTEVWTFLRRPGVKTLKRPGLLEGNCPSCGAPLPIADAAQCSSCKAWVNSGEHDWVLVEITQTSEWQFPDPEREVTGWEELSAADPGLSLEELEDRTSVAFWRWLDARRRADPAPLSGTACDEFLAAFDPGGRFEREGAVGAVLTTACERGAEVDRVHVQVRWEADVFARRPGAPPEELGREQKTHFFVFQRKAGLRSDPRKGLRAARCPACGAPAESADAAACAYCGHKYNDGSTTWVLAEVVPFGVWRRPGNGG